MRITDAIEKLHEILNEHGDLELVSLDDDLYLDYQRDFKMIRPHGKKNYILAYMTPISQGEAIN
jgi:hypothetical protein